MLQRVRNLMRLDPRYAAERAYVRCFGTTVSSFPLIANSLGGRGIEVGGPTPFFTQGHFLPVYPLVESLDGCNYGTETIWEGKIKDGGQFVYGGRVGRQLIAEGWSLPVPDARYDFVLSSHMLEHAANPIKALTEWRRVVKPGGHLLLVLPEGARCFDRKRPLTPLQHLIDDYKADVGEDDLTHLDESVALHDISDTPNYADRDDLRRIFTNNLAHRQMHHHVFDEALGVAVVEYAGFRVLASETFTPWNIVVFAQK